MCGVGSSLACKNYEPNRAWMNRSGNLCWGMGAADQIPCLHCGQKAMWHDFSSLDDEEDE